MMKTIILIAGIICATANVFAQQTYSLDDCRELALKNNKEQKIANEEISKAEYERKAAVTKYFPDLSIKGAYLRNENEISLISENMYLPIGTLTADGFAFTADQINNKWTMINGQAVPLDANGQPFNPKTNPDKILWKEYTTIPKDELTFDTRNIYVASLNLTQPIFYGGKIIAYNKITKLKKELAESKLKTIKEEILVNVDQTYWQIISLNNKKEAVKGLISLLEKMEHDITALTESGLATKADELSVSVKKNEADMALLKVENGIRLSKMLLAQYCGISLDEEYTLADEQNKEIDFNQLKTFDLNEIYANRSEINSLDIAQKIYKQKEKVERASLMPNVALFGNYLGMSPTFTNGYDDSFNFDWHVGIMVNIPLLHWGESIYKLKASKCETTISKYQEENIKEKIELQVKQSAFKYDEAVYKVNITRKNLERAEENLRYATLGFEEGVIPASNLLEAQTAWLSANSDKIDAEIDAKVSEINYQKATGTLVNE